VVAIFFCCSGVLLVAELVSRFKKSDGFVRKLCKLGFKWENKWPVPNSAEFLENAEILCKWANSMDWLKITWPAENCHP